MNSIIHVFIHVTTGQEDSQKKSEGEGDGGSGEEGRGEGSEGGSEDQAVMVYYKRGIYLDPDATLKDLRNAFLDSGMYNICTLKLTCIAHHKVHTM